MRNIARLLLAVTIRPCPPPSVQQWSASCVLSRTACPPPQPYRLVSRDCPSAMSSPRKGRTETVASEDQVLPASVQAWKEASQRDSQRKQTQERKISETGSSNSPQRGDPNRKISSADGDNRPLQKKSSKRKRGSSESSGSGRMSGGGPSQGSASNVENGKEAMQTAAMKLLAAINRAGASKAAECGGQNAAQTSEYAAQTSEYTARTSEYAARSSEYAARTSEYAARTSEYAAANDPGSRRALKPQSEYAARSSERTSRWSGPVVNQQQGACAASEKFDRQADQQRNSGQANPKPQVSDDELLKMSRFWEPTPTTSWPQGHGSEFTFVSYNVLSQHLYDKNPQLYKDALPEDAAWEVRAPLIWDQMMRLGADIVCLQEVEEDDLETFWLPRCRRAGYQLVFKKRTGNDKVDGCAVMYREAAFALQEAATVEYHQPGCKALDRDNVGIVVRLRGSGGDLVVACTHLLYNPKRHDVKLAQVALLLAEVDRLAWCGQRQVHLPILMAGDFNLEPFSPVYQFLRSGWLQYGGLSRKQLTPFGAGEPLLGPLIPPQLGVTAFCRHAAVQMRRHVHRPSENESERRRAERRLLATRHSEHRHPPPPLPLQEIAQEAAEGYLAHGLRLASVYRHGVRGAKEVTTKQGNWLTVDYIFHSVSPPPGSARLELTARLTLPTASICQRLQPYPSAALPSDHLPLAARFRLAPPAAPSRHEEWNNGWNS